jgi:hypothetical protein
MTPTELADGRPRPIHAWSVVGADRLTGVLADGTPIGRRIITSSVVQVVFMGEPAVPVAVTSSGTHYLLGEPSYGGRGETPREFVKRKSGTPRDAAPLDPAPTMTTPAGVTDVGELQTRAEPRAYEA